MKKGLKRISTLNMSREEWLEARRKSIGGSEAAAVCGDSKWTSPYAVWANKRGFAPEDEENEAMRQGRDLEFYVAERFTEATGKKVRRENAILINPDYPFAHAIVDRMIVGEDAVLECKTTSSLNTKRFRDVEFPEDFYHQCVHYLAILGCAKVYLAVLVLGREFFVFELERDEAEINALMEIEREFWSRVESNTPPETDGSVATTKALGKVYPCDDGNDCDLSDYEYSIEKLWDIDEQIKMLKQQKDAITNEIKEYMGENGYGEAPNAFVSWSAHFRETIDTSKLKNELPEIAKKYTKKTIVRDFRIKAKKEA